MFLRPALALSLTFALSACGGGARLPEPEMKLYPTSGPIAAADARTVIEVSTTQESGTSGTISFRLPRPDRTKCEGTWTTVTPRVTTKTRGVSLSIRDLGGSIKRDVADVGGVNEGEIYAVCKDGTRIDGTFVMGSGTASGTGSAQDTRGNVYKLLF